MLDLLVVVKTLAGIIVLAAASGAILAAVARRLPAPTDHRAEAVLAELPGANCGACGMASCFSMAAAMSDGRLPVDACVFGGRRVAEMVGRVLDEQRGRPLAFGALLRTWTRRARV